MAASVNPHPSAFDGRLLLAQILQKIEAFTDNPVDSYKLRDDSGITTACGQLAEAKVSIDTLEPILTLVLEHQAQVWRDYTAGEIDERDATIDDLNEQLQELQESNKILRSRLKAFTDD